MRAKPEFLTAVEIADLFGISVRTARRISAAGAMAASRRAEAGSRADEADA